MRSNQCYVRDIIISKSFSTPRNLVFSPNANTAGFFISFISNASSDIMKKISDACIKKRNEDVEIHFLYKSGNKAPSIPIYSDSQYEDFKNLHIEIGENLESRSTSSGEFSVLNVTFVEQ